jgi:hypothetical protein
MMYSLAILSSATTTPIPDPAVTPHTLSPRATQMYMSTQDTLGVTLTLFQVYLAHPTVLACMLDYFTVVTSALKTLVPKEFLESLVRTFFHVSFRKLCVYIF